MGSIDRVDLAHEGAMTLGALSVNPGTREVRRDDGACEVLEPRVMQVLVALARADGAILTRDDLTQACWDGRVVGEDAINRVLSRLRRVTDGIGSGCFRVETITKVGYRLIRADAPDVASAPPTSSSPAAHAAPSRRGLIVGTGALAAAAVTGVAWWRMTGPAPVPADVLAMMEAGYTSLRQITGEGDLQARGIFRRVTERAPDHADGWAALAYVYASESHYLSPEQSSDMVARAHEAIARARAVDPGNLRAESAEAILLPCNAWAESERRLAAVLRRDPDDDLTLYSLGRTLARVGRMGEAADALANAVAQVEASPMATFDLMSWQWAAGRSEQADRTIARALTLFPRHFAVWFGAFYFRLYSGRVDEAVGMAAAEGDRPAAVPDTEMERVLRMAEAIKTREPGMLRVVRDEQLEAAHLAAGFAENAMQFLAALGFIDDAFAVAEAYYLGRGFQVPSIRFPKGQGTYTRAPDRRTWFLFYPVTAALRESPRFAGLVRDIGLERYWSQSGRLPDYRRATDRRPALR